MPDVDAPVPVATGIRGLRAVPARPDACTRQALCGKGDGDTAEGCVSCACRSGVASPCGAAWRSGEVMQALNSIRMGARRLATLVDVKAGGVTADALKELEAVAAKEGYYAAIRNIPVDSWPSLPKPFLEKALTDLRSFAKANHINRNGVTPHEGFEYLHSAKMYDLDNWPGKKTFVASVVFGITAGGLFIVPGILYGVSMARVKSA